MKYEATSGNYLPNGGSRAFDRLSKPLDYHCLLSSWPDRFNEDIDRRRDDVEVIFVKPPKRCVDGNVSGNS